MIKKKEFIISIILLILILILFITFLINRKNKLRYSTFLEYLNNNLIVSTIDDPLIVYNDYTLKGKVKKNNKIKSFTTKIDLEISMEELFSKLKANNIIYIGKVKNNIILFLLVHSFELFIFLTIFGLIFLYIIIKKIKKSD